MAGGLKLSQMSRLGACFQILIAKTCATKWQMAKTLAVSFSSSAKVFNSDKSKPRTVDISDNPFFDKYKSKIQYIQNTNPGEYQEKLKELSERLNPKKKGDTNTVQPQKVTPPTDVASEGAGMTRSMGLDSVLKLELIQDKTAEEITKIWNLYHSGTDCVYAVLKAHEYQNLMEKAKQCPVFVYQVQRDDGIEFILSQFDRNIVYFTPLAMFQLIRENAPPCLTVTHYPELLEDKGIVLMTGQFDEKVLKQQLALSLVQQMSIFYGQNSKFADIVYRFNYKPETFQYQELIDAFKSLPQYDMK